MGRCRNLGRSELISRNWAVLCIFYTPVDYAYIIDELARKPYPRNVARYHVKLSRKKTDKIFKKKKKQSLISDDSMNDGIIEKLSDECHITKELSTESIPEEMCVDEISEAEPKKTPVFREGKLRRTDLPFHLQDKQKGNERTDRVKPKAAKTSVVAARQMSKKKARKIMRAQRREQRQKQRLASTMEH